MDERKFLSLLGMCRKAGKLSCGHDSSVESIRNKKAMLCVFSSDSSDRLRKEIERECEFAKSPARLLKSDFDMDEIGRASGLRSAVLTVNDSGFAQAMLKALEIREDD
ncbi:MAG: ribosomal L7Ae/L30e/S12e/Gadd45 family protein [Clostridia bacterium]|nr:ribosomal L7Ae/L30e/S12e/Gadd45 family protein [Clostridia bacterium]